MQRRHFNALFVKPHNLRNGVAAGVDFMELLQTVRQILEWFSRFVSVLCHTIILRHDR